MTRVRCARAVAAAMIFMATVPPAFAIDASQRLEARNPFLAGLRKRDPKTFAAAVAIIEGREREKGLSPDAGGAPPAEPPAERGMGLDAGRDLTPGNPDILWLYNSSPEGMNDLISLLKSAGQRPKQ